MGLADDLDKALLTQTKNYQENGTIKETSKDAVDKVNASIKDSSTVPNGGGDTKPSPFPKGIRPSGPKAFLILFGIIISLVVVYFAYSFFTKDRGPDFMQEVEDGNITAFYYTVEERELLRDNGFTADDIERNEMLENNPMDLVKEAEAARKAKYDEEIKPYLDGASEKYKSLERDTWLGGNAINTWILSNPESNDLFTRTYNCDYKKIEPKGAQLFLKLYLTDFNQTLFMTVPPARYVSLNDSGNIVVVVEYYDYADKGIIVTDVREKNITE